MTSPVESVLGSPDMTVPESTIRPGSSASPNTDRPADQIAGGIRSLTETLADQSGSERIGSISVVIPVYNEEGNLPELHRRLTAVMSDLDLPYEFVFVDDGSSDGTWDVVRAFHSIDAHVVALRHRRNFGKAQALANGFAIARGDAVITMDGDLQDDPDELPRFIAELNDGYDLVSGWKQRRQDPLGKTAPSRVFNWTVRRVSNVQLHDFNCGFKGYRNEVTKSIRLYGELHRFTPVLAAAEGFRIQELPVKHHPRTWGTSKYGWSRLVKGFLDLLTVTFLTNYRQRPMHLFGLPGLLSLFLGVLIGLFLTFERLVRDETIGTRPLLMLAVLLVVIGAQFFGLGLLGEFLAHGSNAPKSDPARVLRETIGMNSEPLAGPGKA
jgi:glycosyltransferase involved in cell wall biosynthesis